MVSISACNSLKKADSSKASNFLRDPQLTYQSYRPKPTDRILSRATYHQKLYGFWLGQCIANWTGLRTEGRRIDPPFLTDADWGLVLGPAPLDFEFQTPWGSDDDTDIEYVYLHAMARTGSTWLSPQAIRDAWRKHVNSFIWVSNFNARALMERGVVSPATGSTFALPFIVV